MLDSRIPSDATENAHLASLPIDPSFIPWHRRMEARVAIGVSLLVGLSLGAILLATTRAVTIRSLSRASEDLEVARSTFSRSLESRGEAAAALTRLVTELPVFRAHLTDAGLAADAGTIHQMADGYRQQLKADFCIVTNGHGTWMGSPGWPPKQQPSNTLRASIDAAAAGRSDRDIILIQDRLFLVVSEPARFAEEILGTMTVGYVLDDRVADELAQLTHCQVSLVSGTHLSGSSLRGGERAELARLLARDPAARVGRSTGIRRLGATRYIDGTFPLRPTQAPASPDRLVLLQDWQPTQQFLDELQWQFLGAAAIIFSFALAGGLLFSRRMSQPLREIAAAARDIAGGNWARQVPMGGTAEAATMAVAFNAMSTSLRGAQDRLLHDAFHDHLTQLPNRALFMDRLQRATTRRSRHAEYSFAVLFVDLDRFKAVNDSLGHPAGDRLLLEIARRLTGALRRDDTVSRPVTTASQDHTDDTLARVGGDEFTLLLEDLRNPSDAVRIAERIQQAVSAPVSLGGQEVFTSASIGIAVSTAVDSLGEDLLRDADIAMYRAKASGGDRCAVFDATMHKRAVERLQLETDLRRAIERHEFRLHYQPIVSLHDRRVIGFEALIRWQHPEQGLLSPAAFLKVAEETGLIARIDEWALREACGQARQWQSQVPSESPASVSVNISAQGFGQPDIVRQVANVLEETGLNPHSLRLEITESVAMADAERARTILIDLKGLGVRISLDDFGTGYSSLSYLQRFPVDTLKIDQSFVARMEHNHECREIIRTILNLARTLGLDVIAEGIETAAQGQYLEGLDCRFGQGYSFSRPLPLDELRAVLASGVEGEDRMGILPATSGSS
jgi:predicted signal transduction protein with EAL and GGDEF domain